METGFLGGDDLVICMDGYLDECLQFEVRSRLSPYFKSE